MRYAIIFILSLSLVAGGWLTSGHCASITEADLDVHQQSSPLAKKRKKKVKKADSQEHLPTGVKTGTIEISPKSKTRTISVRSVSDEVNNLGTGRNVDTQSSIGGVRVQ